MPRVPEHAYEIVECAVGTDAVSQPFGVGPVGIVAGPDGNIWFTESRGTGGGGGIGRVSPDCTDYTDFTAGLTPGGLPISIVNGPDGNMWFTEWFGGKIGRVTVDGVITEVIQLPAGLVGYEILAGPDGNMWFTAQDYAVYVHALQGGLVGRFSPDDPAGTLKTWQVPGLPAGLTVGPDGNIWLMQGPRWTDGQGGGIATISLDGRRYTFYPFPEDKPHGPQDSTLTTAELTTGPDGNLWFTEEWGQYVGRFSPADLTFSFFSEGMDVGNMHLSYIMTAADGNMYIDDHGAGAYLIYRVTPDGNITGIPSWDGSAGGTYHTEAPNGDIWGTKSDGSGIQNASYISQGRLYRMKVLPP